MKISKTDRLLLALTFCSHSFLGVLLEHSSKFVELFGVVQVWKDEIFALLVKVRVDFVQIFVTQEVRVLSDLVDLLQTQLVPLVHNDAVLGRIAARFELDLVHR